MPIVPATAVRPSSSGSPAATRAPNATSRISSVIGSDSVSAFWRSLLERAHELLVGAGGAELGDVEVRIGLLDRLGDGQRRVDARLGLRGGAGHLEGHLDGVLVGRDEALAGVACRRGSGPCWPRAARPCASRDPDDSAVRRIIRLQGLALDENDLAGAGGRLGEGVVLEMVCARPESPAAACSAVLVPVPNGPPRANAAMTTASQPKMAVLRCWALQRPARAAMALGLLTHLRTLLGRLLHDEAQRRRSQIRSLPSHPASGGHTRPGRVVRFSTRRWCG